MAAVIVLVAGYFAASCLFLSGARDIDVFVLLVLAGYAIPPSVCIKAAIRVKSNRTGEILALVAAIVIALIGIVCPWVAVFVDPDPFTFLFLPVWQLLAAGPILSLALVVTWCCEGESSPAN